MLKKIAYWLAVFSTLVPVIAVDALYLRVQQAPVIGLVAVIIMQILCAVFFVIMSRQKRFYLAFRWLAGFGATGFVVLAMTIVCTGFRMD